MKTRLSFILTIMIIQLSVANICFANDDNTKTIYGFVFQDNDRNGDFDESDNTFPSAFIKVQALDGDSVEVISVDSTGYFETRALQAGEYYVWAEHYDLIGEKRLVEISHASTAGMLVIGLSKPEVLVRNIDDPSFNVDESQADEVSRTHDDPSLNVDVPQAELDMSLPQMETDMNILPADIDMSAPVLNLSIMLPLISS